MGIFEQIKNDLIEAIRSSEPATKAYDTDAQVVRVEGSTAWVHIPGGVDETPVKLTIDVKAGDKVQLRVSGGSAWIVGNETAPPTDDTTAKTAYAAAVSAEGQAKSAMDYAGDAAAAAASAEHSAVVANGAANNALVQLSVVEDVAGTLNWIREHGSYTQTEDTTVVENKIYFIYQDGDYIPIANPDPGANPAAAGWYELDVSSSQAEYIMAHLAVTSAGLWVLPASQYAERQVTDSNGNTLVDSQGNQLVDWAVDPQNASGYKVLLSAAGMIVYDETGAAVASYGPTTTIGKTYGNNVYIDSNSVNIREGTEVLAKFSGDGAVFGKDGDDSVTTTDNTGLYVKYKYINAEEEEFSVPVIVLKPYDAGDPFIIPIIAAEYTGDGSTTRFESGYISADPEGYIDIEDPKKRVFAVLLDGIKTEEYTVEAHYYPETPEASGYRIVFNTAPETGKDIQIVMYADMNDIILYKLTPFYPEHSSIIPAVVFAETVGFMDYIRVGKGIYIGEERVKTKYNAADIVEFSSLRVPGVATDAGTVYGSLILDKPIDPTASVAITYTGGYVRGAGVSISGATITADIDYGGHPVNDASGHALNICAAKSSSFTQYETYMIVLTGVTITFS